MKRPAVTLIELILVISIIGILVSVVALDFGQSRRRQELNLMVEQSIALLQQQLALANAGYLESDLLACTGAFFELGKQPRQAYLEFQSEEADCVNPVDSNYGFSSERVAVTSIEVGDVPVTQAWILFLPPEGNVEIYNGDMSSVLVGDAKVSFGREGVEGERALTVNYLTGQIHYAQ